jgi:hypothetical protein
VVGLRLLLRRGHDAERGLRVGPEEELVAARIQLLQLLHEGGGEALVGLKQQPLDPEQDGAWAWLGITLVVLGGLGTGR